jgi:regulator of sirC expression with transglutaminase-like and TPR domain
MVQPRHRFDELVQRDDGDIRLAEAALLFAADHCRGLKIAPWLNRLDELARRVDAKHAGSGIDQVDALRNVLIDEENFGGDTAGYYDTRNSLLNKVMERRVGIPISLSVVWLDICNQLNWPFVGVGLPGHFIIKRMMSDDELLVDPFGNGRSLSRIDCERIVGSIQGEIVQLDNSHFQPASKKEILLRMLNNLRGICYGRQAWHDACLVLARMLAIQPDSIELKRELVAATANLAKLN